MYAKNLSIHKDTDNVIFFEFKNPDQKKVSILGKTMVLNIFREHDGGTYLSIPITNHDAPNGIATVTITKDHIMNLEPALYYYAIEVVDAEGNNQTAYVNDNYGVRGVLDLQPGPLPLHKPSLDLSFIPVSSTIARTSVAQGLASGNHNQALHSAQLYFDDFTGTITIQATMDDVADSTTASYFVVNTMSFTSQSDPVIVSFNGVYSGVRFESETTSGSALRVLYRK